MKAAELDTGKIEVDPETSKERLVNPLDSEYDDKIYYYIPPQRVVTYRAYEKVGKVYARDVHDRGWDHWLSLVTANPELLEQEIRVEIPSLYRIKDRDGKEWLYYHKNMYGKDHEDNEHDFPELEGFVEIPLFHTKRDPITKKVIPETTEVRDTQKIFTIPFTKAKLEELAKYFAPVLRCAIVDQNGTRLSCSESELRDMPYDELLSDKNGLAEYARQKRAQKAQQKVYQ